jgi:hypothetical protein
VPGHRVGDGSGQGEQLGPDLGSKLVGRDVVGKRGRVTGMGRVVAAVAALVTGRPVVAATLAPVPVERAVAAPVARVAVAGSA